MFDIIGYLVSWVSYRVVLICLGSVPLTHALGLYFYKSRLAVGRVKISELLLFPFTGGNRHIVFQLFSWVLWGVAAAAITPVYISFGLKRQLPIIPHTHVDVVSGAAAVSSFVGELFMVKAMLVYRSKDALDLPEGKEVKDAQAHALTRVLPPRLASALVVLMGLLITITGCTLLLALDYMPDMPSRVLYCCLATSCFCIGASSTYGLGGHLRYGAPTLERHSSRRKRATNGARLAKSDSVKSDESKSEDGDSDDEEPPSAWQFFQPFAGGTAFVATQAVGWSLFAATVVCLVVMAERLVAGVAHCARCWALGAGTLMVITHAVLGLSLLTYQGRKRARRLIQPLLHPGTTGASTLGILGPVVLMYLPLHIFFTVWALAFVFMPLKLACGLFIAFIIPYYTVTLRGDPAHTGCHRWPALCEFTSRNIEGSLRWWFGSLEVIKDWQGSPDPEAKYIFGFHPHGLYPTGAGFLPLMPTVQAAYPGITPITLTATIMHYVPGLRNIAMWAGFRQVSRPTFKRALAERRSVLMCPGGQAELVHTHRAFLPGEKRELAIFAGHKGFVRLALQQGASLVPVLAIGESLQVRNGLNWPGLMKWTYKRLGFPVPYLLVGRWGITTLPLRVPLVYVLGEPIPPPEGLEPGHVTQEQVDAQHAKFYHAMERMWEAHHHRHPVLKDARMTIIWSDKHHSDKHHRASHADASEARAAVKAQESS